MPANFSGMPAEIHLNIFEQTRSEVNGRLPIAICSLSKRLTDIAYPLFYRIILLENGRSVESFSHTLRSKPELAKYAKHLLLGDADRINEVPPDFVFAMARSQQARAERFKQLHDWSTARDGRLAGIRSAAYHILSTLSPYLRSLTILYYGHYGLTNTGLNDLLHFIYPSLTELTLMGNYSMFEDNVQMPKIENLHLIGELSNSNVNVDFLSRYFPCIKRLRLSAPALNTSMTKFIQSIREAQDRMPSIGRLLLQFPLQRTSSSSMIQNDEFEAIAQEAQHDLEFFHLIPPESDGYTYALAKRDWVDRTLGGDGCWHVD